MRIRDAGGPRVQGMVQEGAEYEAFEAREESMRLLIEQQDHDPPPADEERDGCWPSCDLVYYLVLKNRAQQRLEKKRKRTLLRTTRM